MSIHGRILFITAIVTGMYGCAITPGGGQIHIPTGQGPFPAILVLHTSGGLTRYEKSYASRLSREGFVATAVKSSDSETVILDHLVSLPYVDPNRIGVVGFSSGAVSALSLASRQRLLHGEKPITGVVSYYIGFSIVHWVESLEHPPTLFLHGDQDVYVKPFEIINYCDLQREKGAICDYHIYKGVRHAFNQKSSYNGYDRAATADAWKRALAFLNLHVKRKDQ